MGGWLNQQRKSVEVYGWLNEIGYVCYVDVHV